jgi:hypothetical protein
MRYKAEYAPSQLLCPVTGHWVDLAAAVPRLDKDKHAALADVPEAELADKRAREMAAMAALIPRVPLLLNGRDAASLVTLADLTPQGRTIVADRILKPLLPRTGPVVSERLVVIVQ